MENLEGISYFCPEITGAGHLDSLVSRQVYQKQLHFHLPWPAREVSDICEQIQIPDINYSKVLKVTIEEAIFFN